LKTYYILFQNSTEGMAMYNGLKNEGIKTIIAPTPRKLSTSCGISLMFKDESIINEIELIAKNHRLHYIKIDFVDNAFDKNRGKYC